LEDEDVRVWHLAAASASSVLEEDGPASPHLYAARSFPAALSRLKVQTEESGKAGSDPLQCSNEPFGL
jgi:hypothetical protein